MKSSFIERLTLPGILSLLSLDSAHSLSLLVSPATLALSLPPHQTDGEKVLGSRVRELRHHHVLRVLRPLLPAHLLGLGLVPARHELETVATNIPPSSRTLPAWGGTGAQPGEVVRVSGGLHHHQPHHGQQVEDGHHCQQYQDILCLERESL